MGLIVVVKMGLKFTPKILKVNKKTGDITLSLKDFSRITYLLGRLEVYMEYLKQNKELK